MDEELKSSLFRREAYKNQDRERISYGSLDKVREEKYAIVLLITIVFFVCATSLYNIDIATNIIDYLFF